MILFYQSSVQTTETQRKSLEEGLRMSFPGLDTLKVEKREKKTQLATIDMLVVGVEMEQMYLNSPVKDMSIASPLVGEIQHFVSGFLWGMGSPCTG